MLSRSLKNCLVIFALCAAAPLAADDESDRIGQQLVDDFVNEVITFSASFKQSLVDSNGETTDQSSGTLLISRPGKFRWATDDPYEQLLVADGLNIWSYDIDLEQVTVKPQAEALANTPAMLLGGSDAALDQFNYGGTTIEKETTWVRFDPKDTSSGFERMELGFVDSQLQRMIFFDHLDQTTLVALDDLVVNEAIDSERFEFEIPEDVDVVGTPAESAP